LGVKKISVDINKSKRVVLIIQARMGSTRLPGKSMMDLAGAPLVGRILERVKRCTKVDEIILAIPDSKENQLLKKLADDYNVKCYMGSEDDLVDRYYQAATASKADFVVRLPADNTTPEPVEIDKIIDYHLTLGRPGFSSNLAQIYNSGYPDGIGAEIFDYSLLRIVQETVTDSFSREHVHLNFFNYETNKAVNSDWCPVNTIKCPIEFSRPDLILDVNTMEQYLFMKSLYENLYPINSQFNIIEIIDWYDNCYKNDKND
jgi:spore coat polysaccharide biosynthesis protein SpsF